MWVARHEDGHLTAYATEAPIRLTCVFKAANHDKCFALPKELCPELTWENSPKEVKFIGI